MRVHHTSHAPPHSAGPARPLLREGAKGSAVVTLQKLLAARGFSPGAADGAFGPHTQAAVEHFQRAHGLSVDGVVGPRTWAALEHAGAPNHAPAHQPAPTHGKAPVHHPAPAPAASLRQKILQVAESQVGGLEVGNNGGIARKYQGYFGRGQEAWCADFVSWVYSHAGKRMNNPYCPSIVNQLKHDGHWKGRHNPQPGDMVLFDWNGDGVADHIGIVKHVNSNGTITTIEGNTGNPQTGREGVWQRTRAMSVVLGFGNP